MKTDSWLERLLYLWPVKILSIAAAILLYFFTNFLSLETRPITVPIRYNLPTGFTQAEAYPTSAQVTLRGSKKIYDINENDIQLSADLSSHEGVGVYKAALKIRRIGFAADIKPLEISIDPVAVNIALERTSFKDVPIEYKSTGIAPIGFEMIGQSSPITTVRIGGPQNLIATVNSVVCEAIDISNHEKDFTQKVRIKSPDPLIKILSDDLIEVKTLMRESDGAASFDSIPIAVVGLDPGLTLNQKLPNATIKLHAKSGVLLQIDPSQIRMIIDASSYKAPGKYQVKIIPEVPADILVLSYQPTTLELKLDAASEHTTP